MRWGVKDRREQRIEFVIRSRSSKETISQLCREFEISRPTGYLWLKRYREGGDSLASMMEKSRRPKTSPQRTAAAVEARVVELRQQDGWGAKAIRHVLGRDEGIRLGRMTVHRILERYHLIKEEDRHRPATKRFERDEPNQLWQMDFKGQFPMGTRQCFPLSVLDDHSRYLIGLRALTGTGTEGVHQTLVGLFREHGVPEAMLMDHGVPWWNAMNGQGLTKLSVNLIQQGIRLYYSGVRHPQTQGKVEKFHDTLRRSVEHHNRWPEQLEAWEEEFVQFRQIYNHRRPHEALGMEVPATRYSKSPRAYQSTPLRWEYPDRSNVRRLNSQGQFYWKHRYIFVSQALADQEVGIDTVDDAIVIRFRHMFIRQINPSTGHGVALMTPVEQPMQTAAAVGNL
jgi:transposase InsO family protein